MVTQPSPITPQELEANLAVYLLADMRDRLTNWGAWWRKENIYEIRLSTGIQNQSVLYKLMRIRGIRAGYRGHSARTNTEDAQALHDRLQSELTEREYQAIFDYYVHGNGGTGADISARGRAVKRLVGLVKTQD